MNPVVAIKRFGYLRANLNRPFRIQIQCHVASGVRKAGGANERPHFATRSRNELRQLFRWHATPDYSSGNRLRMGQFDLAGHKGLCQETAYCRE